MYQYPKINPDVFNPQEVYEVKLLLAYFLNRTSQNCTPAQLLEIFTGEGVVDYFLYTEAIKEMLESGLMLIIKRDGVEYYTLSEKGRAGAESFKRLVNKSVRDRIVFSGMRLFARLKAEQTVHIEINDLDGIEGGPCEVCCTVVDNNVRLLELKLFAPDRTQAEHMKKKIMANPSELYGRILEYVVCNEEEYIEPFDDEL